MNNLVRMSVVCGACGASVTIYDEECLYCGSKLETINEVLYRLPGCSSHSNAKHDASSLEVHLYRLLSNYHYRPITIDEIIECLMIIMGHNYTFVDFLYDTLSLTHKYRSMCFNTVSEETRLTKLDLLKRLNAIYKSLTGNNYLPQ